MLHRGLRTGFDGMRWGAIRAQTLVKAFIGRNFEENLRQIQSLKLEPLLGLAESNMTQDGSPLSLPTIIAERLSSPCGKSSLSSESDDCGSGSGLSGNSGNTADCRTVSRFNVVPSGNFQNGSKALVAIQGEGFVVIVARSILPNGRICAVWQMGLRSNLS